MYISTYLFVHSIGSRKRNRKDRFANQIDKPNTETIAYMDLFSQLENKQKNKEIEIKIPIDQSQPTEQYMNHRLYYPKNMN